MNAESFAQMVDVLADGSLRLLRSGPVTTIELNQPSRRNAISQAMWSALPDAVQMIETDRACRSVIVRGAGDVFSAGADISEFSTVYADGYSAGIYNDLIRDGLQALRDVARPTIALIDGICIGGGCSIAMACDLRFASEKASFAITPAKLGLAYSVDDTSRLIEKVGPSRAKEILFSGRRLGAAEALAIGLIDRLVASDALEVETLAFAGQLSTVSQASIRTIKATINSIAEGGRDRDRIEDMIAGCFEGADFREGYSAFLEKRPPKFL